MNGTAFMNLAHEAYVQLYAKEPAYRMIVKYHGKLHGYNATVKKNVTTISFNLSQKFKGCEPEIQIGVMQFLLNKLMKTRMHSDNIDLYHSFLKKMSDLAPVTKNDPDLEQSFQRMNERYFSGMLNQPNLVWGNDSRTLLGTYTYASDTITISAVLQGNEPLLDYVMYHEMLHKKHKFNHTGTRQHSHTKAFREDEKRFHDPHAETKLKHYLRQRMPRRAKSFIERIMNWS